jgi:hypothetical protein
MADCLERHSEADPNPEDPAAEAEGAADEEDWEAPPKKKKKINEPREWVEVKRWKCEENALKDIKEFIRAELDELNRSAGILHVPGAHKDGNNEYGDLQCRRYWLTKKNQVEHFSLHARSGKDADVSAR